MRNVRIVIAVLFIFSVATVASAQATRTWVSGVGDDVNPCSRTAPCKTFAGAISKTAAGGEINVLDSGGFGAVTITKSITIDGGMGVHASILFSGTNGVNVNDSLSGSPNTIEVTLRNLALNGAGSTIGIDGIRFVSGKRLTVENCFIQTGSGDGIEVLTTAGDLSLQVKNTTIQNFNVGMNVHPTAASGNFFVNVNDVWINDISSSSGLVLNGGIIRAQVANSVFSRMPTGAGIAVQVSGADVSLDHVRSHNNQFGLLVANSGVTVRLKDCMLQGTSNSVSAVAGSTVTPFSSNVLIGPQTNVAASVALQ